MSLDTFLMTDQPETCRKCGARTEIVDDFTTDREGGSSETRHQLHQCPECGYRYWLDDDSDEPDEDGRRCPDCGSYRDGPDDAAKCCHCGSTQPPT